MFKSIKGVQLNKYIAESGLCSRRRAELLIKSGHITVNNNIITESGYRVTARDKVKYKDEIIKPKSKIYILLNKPKGYITTLSDEKSRKTVLDLVQAQIKERVFPVGRLDRATTGLLLLTNDGEFAQRLAHPSYKIEKTYIVTLDQAINEKDFSKILAGIKLLDGFIKPDKLEYVNHQPNILRISVHSGKNRIIRRIFEHFGYKIKKLDRVKYGILTKKNLPQGHWRILTEKEILTLSKSQNKK